MNLSFLDIIIYLALTAIAVTAVIRINKDPDED